MHDFRLAILLALLAPTLPTHAADVDVRVIVSGDVRPGIYGRVDVGSAPPPPLVYATPVVVARPPPRPVPVLPIYLHVPPGHAKHWSKHCQKYNACGVPVYFVRSQEYEPKKAKKEKQKERKEKKDD